MASTMDEMLDKLEKLTDEDIVAALKGFDTQVANSIKTQLMFRGRFINTSDNTDDEDEDDYIDAEDYEDDEEDGIDFVIVDDKPKKGRKGTRKKAEKEVVKAKLFAVPTLPEYEDLPSDITFELTMNTHDIHYKEQLWGIGRRKVEYCLAPVKPTAVAKRVAGQFGDSHEDADEGRVRYLEIRSYVESLPTRAKSLGFIRMFKNNGKYQKKIALDKGLCASVNIDPEKAMQIITVQLNQAIDKINRK